MANVPFHNPTHHTLSASLHVSDGVTLDLSWSPGESIDVDEQYADALVKLSPEGHVVGGAAPQLNRPGAERRVLSDSLPGSDIRRTPPWERR